MEKVHWEGVEVRQRPIAYFSPFFSTVHSPKGLSGPEKQITHKLNKLKNNIPSGRRQTSWLCTSAAKDLNQVELAKHPAASHSGTCVKVKSVLNLLELSFFATTTSPLEQIY